MISIDSERYHSSPVAHVTKAELKILIRFCASLLAKINGFADASVEGRISPWIAYGGPQC